MVGLGYRRTANPLSCSQVSFFFKNKFLKTGVCSLLSSVLCWEIFVLANIAKEQRCSWQKAGELCFINLTALSQESLKF